MAENNSFQGIGLNALLTVNDQIVPLVKITTSIGRSLDNDVVIQKPLISRRHAEIRYEESQFIVYDLKSTGGTFINGNKINRGVLFSGDTIMIANVPILFMMEGAQLADASSKETGKLDLTSPEAGFSEQIQIENHLENSETDIAEEKEEKD